jgi:hypothetical protein
MSIERAMYLDHFYQAGLDAPNVKTLKGRTARIPKPLRKTPNNQSTANLLVRLSQSPSRLAVPPIQQLDLYII